MTWIKIDDGFAEHPKVEHLSDAAFHLYVAGLCYAGRTLSDGRISKQMSGRLVPRQKRGAVAELVTARLWDEREDGGFVIHDYLDYNPSKAKVYAERDWAAKRKELHNSPALVAAIRARDRDLCRYCGERVNWKDRRGPLGATYDHVEARGPNTLENVVVACRGCNAAKSNHSPAEVGMVLLPPPRPRSGPRSESSSDLATPTRPGPKGQGSESVLSSELDGEAAQGGSPGIPEDGLEKVRELRAFARRAAAGL